MFDYLAKNPHILFDTIIKEFDLKNDAALAKFLDVSAPVISKIRSNKLNIGGDYILRVYDKTGWHIDDIRDMLKEQKDQK